MNELLWWGYLHTNGKIQVKRCYSEEDNDWADAQDSPFVVKVVHPFSADSREGAIRYIEEALKGGM
jgi:hypothetical protein